MPKRSTPRRALTEKAVEAARYRGQGGAHCIVWDATLPGLGLRVYPTERKAWVLYYRTQAGRKRLHQLGRWPEITLAKARELARRRLVEVAEGGDPSADRTEARRQGLFGVLAEAYLERHAKRTKRSARDDAQRIRQYLKPAWGNQPAAAISRSDVAALHRRIGRAHPYAANRTLSLVSHIFNWGEAEGLLPEGHPNPTRGVRRFREQSRERWLTRAEVRALLRALAEEPSPYVRAFFQLALLTGCRKGELLRARWADVDLEAGLLRLPRTKAGRVHLVPLSEPAQGILRRLPRQVGSPYVFPAVRGRGHLVDVETTWRRIRAAAGCADARLHDLRRTVGSWMAQEGASLPIIGAVLNHSNPSTTAVYARLSEQAGRVALERHAESLLRATGEEALGLPEAL